MTAIADTHPQGGAAKASPFMGSAVAKPIARKSLNWETIERPTPQQGSLTWDSRRRVWVDARSGQRVAA